MSPTYQIPTETHLTDSSKDLFRYGELSNNLLENILLNMVLPNSFGIYGNWGSGKTSFLHFLKEHLEKKPDVLTVYFDAWQYEYSKEGDLLFALLNQIEESFKADLTDKIKTGVEEGFKKILKLALAVGMGVGRYFNVDPDGTKSDLEYLEGELYPRHKLWVDNTKAFQSEFQKVVQDSLKAAGKTKLILIVDDLDRCLPEETIRILEAIKHFLSVESTLFILAIDRRAVSEMIQKKYGLYDGYGDEYLMKIVHYYYELPKPTLTMICDEVLTPLKSFVTYEEGVLNHIVEFYGTFAREPRKIKHYLNHFVFKALLSSKIQKSIKAGEKHFIAALVMDFLLLRFPGTFADGDANRKLSSVSSGVHASKSNGEYERMLAIDTSIEGKDRKILESILIHSLLKSFNINIDDLNRAYDLLNDYRF